MKSVDAPFQQIIDPIAGSLVLSAICAALPLILLFVLLGVFKVKAHKAALASLLLSVVLALLGWQMPVGQTLSAVGAGAVYGMIPILWILINALWIFKLTVATPWFEVLGRTIRSISDDMRILSILIAFCFGALLEALAGFGAPVAITAAMLLAAGMKPLKSAMVALLANTAPVAFGSVAAPIIALSGVTGLPIHDLASMIGRQTPFMALLVPLVLVFIVDGKRGVKQTWPVAVVAGVVFAVAQFFASNFLAVELVDVIAALATIAAVLVMLRFWQPCETIGLPTAAANAPSDDVRVRTGAVGDDGGLEVRAGASAAAASLVVATSPIDAAPVKTTRPEPRQVWTAIAPYLIIIVIFSIAQVPIVKAWLTAFGSVTFQWPGLDVTDPEGNPVVAQLFKLDHLKAAGTSVLISGAVLMALYKITPRQGLQIYRETLLQLRWTIVTVTAVLALSFVMNLSGQASTLGVALASTGGFFAVLSPLLGWIGVALTGSDTSSNSLFGQLQVSAANSSGLSPVLMAAANSSAGVLGKMLSLQNLAVAAAAVGLAGAESTLLRKLIGWSLGLLVLMTLLIWLQSTPVLGWMVP
ncbi:L-lactate permease [Cryobacterium gelidum]|uniref:L-lactate permease n=1 Tax=Cryobacterium gelidum TaxID=1259164 RepID=A0A4R9AX90_9MICO|nr:L-lactate permease [Cryobacterium gelidum]TFD72299.1 L-lactate permease [Cryobacterium gelidum]